MELTETTHVQEQAPFLFHDHRLGYGFIYISTLNGEFFAEGHKVIGVYIYEITQAVQAVISNNNGTIHSNWDLRLAL